jgi:Tol biopolymer transport system component
LPDGQGFTGLNRHVVALSRDGTQIVYVANSQLHLRVLSEGSGQPIPGTDGFRGVSEPAFSPDGRSIVFYAFDGTLRRIAVTGGAAVTLAKVPDNPYGLHWEEDGIVFGLGGLGIMRVSADGGTPDVIVRVKDGEQAHGPQLLSSDRVLFTLATGTATDRWDQASVVVQSIASGERSTLIDGGQRCQVHPDRTPRLRRQRQRVRRPVRRGATANHGQPGPCRPGRQTRGGQRDGRGALQRLGHGFVRVCPRPDLGLVDADGHRDCRPPGKGGAAATPARAVHGPARLTRRPRIAFGTDDGKEANVHVYDLSGRTVMRQLTNEGNNRFPVWSPNGARITFQSDRDGDLALFWQPADGTGAAERLTTPGTAESHAPESWSRDGNTLLFSVTKGSEVTLWMLSLPDRKTTRFGAVRSTIPIGAVFSRDGRWVAYASAAANRTTIYVEPFPQTGARYQIPAKGSDTPKQPRWSWDGKELFYNPNSNTFEAMSVSTTPTFALGNAVTLTRRLLLGPPTSRTNYDPMPDGRFVGVVTAGEVEFVRGSANQIQVILNWHEELKRLAPVP